MANTFYVGELECPYTFAEEWDGQIIQTSTAGTAVLPTVSVAVGNTLVTLPVVSNNSRFTVSKGGTGKYVVTFVHSLAGILSSNATLQTASTTGKVVSVGPISLANQTIEFDVRTASTGALVNLSTGDSVHFRVVATGDNSQGNLE